MVDIIILADSKNAHLVQMTQSAIDTCHESEKDIQFNILVLEQADVQYDKAKTVKMTEPFNYNRYMNIAIGMTSNPFVCLCNNDLLFHKNWASNIIRAMEQNDLLSASPKCPIAQSGRVYDTNVVYGYRNRHELNGWCIMTDRGLYEKIGKIDEEFEFWFADNIYSEQLKRHGVKHALIVNSHVTHIGSQTLHTIDSKTHERYTTGAIPGFCQKHPKNESAIHFKNRK